MRRFHFTVIAALSLFAVANTALPQQQTLAELKAAAERGEPEAQDKLGDVFNIHFLDPVHAVPWYRKAAAHGIANSQYRLAHILVGWAKSPIANTTGDGRKEMEDGRNREHRTFNGKNAWIRHVTSELMR